MNNILYTIGHYTHNIDYFISLLKKYSINVLCDVRSIPYSKFNSQFNKDKLKYILNENNIEYVFLGNELGGKGYNTEHYMNGILQY